MKQYDNLWVQTGNGEVVPHDARTINGKFFRPEKDKIVVTIKDLRNLWEAGREFEQDERMNGFYKRPYFTQYLKEQGLNTMP